MGSAGSMNLYTVFKKPLASYLSGRKEEIQKGLYTELLPTLYSVQYLNVPFPA